MVAVKQQDSLLFAAGRIPEQINLWSDCSFFVRYFAYLCHKLGCGHLHGACVWFEMRHIPVSHAVCAIRACEFVASDARCKCTTDQGCYSPVADR